ncbi:hypothetical protein [Rhodococcus spongiicola]|uniref:hypothetical protein n=1 Tax=Rhodococcus spongiicola TaxID=2487352 RepID=UPI0013E2EDD9|nr:hypothetical protein [Rhodococcus spongiicola]
MNLDEIDLGSLSGAAAGSVGGLIEILFGLGLGAGSVFGGSTIGDLGSTISFS